jgi:hypothetical protein
MADELVRSDEHAAPFVAARHELEEQVRASLLEGQAA